MTKQKHICIVAMPNELIMPFETGSIYLWPPLIVSHYTTIHLIAVITTSHRNFFDECKNLILIWC